MSNIDQMIAFENGELDDDDILVLFSELIKSGTINHLQGHYGRNAAHMIEAGYLDWNGNILVDI